MSRFIKTMRYTTLLFIGFVMVGCSDQTPPLDVEKATEKATEDIAATNTELSVEEPVEVSVGGYIETDMTSNTVETAGFSEMVSEVVLVENRITSGNYAPTSSDQFFAAMRQWFGVDAGAKGDGRASFVPNFVAATDEQLAEQAQQQALIEKNFTVLPPSVPPQSEVEQVDAQLREAMLTENCPMALAAIEAGADPNVMVSAGQNALFSAIYQNNTVMTRALLAAGADMQVLNAYQLSPLALAKLREDRRMSAILLARSPAYAEQRALLLNYAKNYLSMESEWVHTILPRINGWHYDSRRPNRDSSQHSSFTVDYHMHGVTDASSAIAMFRDALTHRQSRSSTEANINNMSINRTDAVLADSGGRGVPELMSADANDAFNVVEESQTENLESSDSHLAKYTDTELQATIEAIEAYQRQNAAVNALLDGYFTVDDFDPSNDDEYDYADLNAQAVNLYLVLNELALLPGSGFTHLQLPPFELAGEEATESHYLLKIMATELAHNPAASSGETALTNEVEWLSILNQQLDSRSFRRDLPPADWDEILRREALCEDAGKQWVYGLTQSRYRDESLVQEWLIKAAKNGSLIAKYAFVENANELYYELTPEDAALRDQWLEAFIHQGHYPLAVEAMQNQMRLHDYIDGDAGAEAQQAQIAVRLRRWLELSLASVKQAIQAGQPLQESSRYDSERDSASEKIIQMYLQYFLTDDIQPNLYAKNWQTAFEIVADPIWAEQAFIAELKKELTQGYYSLSLPQASSIRSDEYTELKQFMRDQLLKNGDVTMALLSYQELDDDFYRLDEADKPAVRAQGIAALLQAVEKGLPEAEAVYLQALLRNSEDELLPKNWPQAFEFMFSTAWREQPENQAAMYSMLAGYTDGFVRDNVSYYERDEFVSAFQTAYFASDFRLPKEELTPEEAVERATRYFSNLRDGGTQPHPAIDFSELSAEDKNQIFVAMTEARYVQERDVQWLIQAGIDPMNLPSNYLHDYLSMWQWSEDAKFAVLHWWEAAGGDHDQRNADGDDLLMAAIRNRNVEFARHLLYHGADINAPTGFTGERAQYDTVLKYLLVTLHDADLKEILNQPYFDLPENAVNDFISYHAFHVHFDPTDAQSHYSFDVIDADGGLASDTDEPGICWRDDFTGLYWERNIEPEPDGSINNRDPEFKYTQKNSTLQCGTISCDAESYVAYINQIKLCGRTDWRVPTQSNLQQLHDQMFPEDLHGTSFATLTPDAAGNMQWGYAKAHETADAVAYDTSEPDPAYSLILVAGDEQANQAYTGPDLSQYLPIQYADTYGPSERIRIFDEFYPPEVVAARKARAQAKAESEKAESAKTKSEKADAAVADEIQ